MIHSGSPDSFQVTNQEIQQYIEEVNSAYPAFGLTLNDISLWNAGLVLFGDNKSGAQDLRYGKRSRIVDHERVDGLKGLVTLIGVRYTTARYEAAKTVDLVFQKLKYDPPPSRTDSTPVIGGGIGNFKEFVQHASYYLAGKVDSKTLQALVRNYGSEFQQVWAYVDQNPSLGETVPKTSVLKAEILHAVREEMAIKLTDVVLRRTDLGVQIAQHTGHGRAVQAAAEKRTDPATVLADDGAPDGIAQVLEQGLFLFGQLGATAVPIRYLPVKVGAG